MQKRRESKRLSKSISYGLCTASIGCFAGLLIGLSALKTISLSLASAALAITAYSYYPKHLNRKYAASIEKELPFALLEAGTNIELGLSFEKTLEAIASQKNNLGKEFRKALTEIKEYSASPEEALRALSKRVDSIDVKRAIAQLIGVYEQGGREGKGKGVKEIGAELLEKQHSMHKEFNQKLVLYGLVFVVISAIIPALMQSMNLVGAMFLDMSYSKYKAFLFPAALYPLIDVCVLAFIRLKTPLFLR